MRNDRERLLDIREAIENIQKYAAAAKMLLGKTSLFRPGYYIIFKSSVKQHLEYLMNFRKSIQIYHGLRLSGCVISLFMITFISISTWSGLLLKTTFPRFTIRSYTCLTNRAVIAPPSLFYFVGVYGVYVETSYDG